LAKRTSIQHAVRILTADHSHDSYSLHYASRGANVVVNDFNKKAAQKVVDDIVRGVLS
jgi:hypothetical protein